MENILIPILIILFLWLVLAENSKLKPESKVPPRERIRFFFIGLSIVAVANLGQSITEIYSPARITIPVHEVNYAAQYFKEDSVRPLIRQYSNTEIRGIPAILTDNNGGALNIIAALVNQKNNIIDSLLLCIIVIASMFKLWSFDMENPFGGQLSKITFTISKILLVFWVLGFAKIYLVNLYIKNKTQGDYEYQDFFSFFNSIHLWLGAILFRLSQIIHRGEQLQKEQDLTV